MIFGRQSSSCRLALLYRVQMRMFPVEGEDDCLQTSQPGLNLVCILECSFGTHGKLSLLKCARSKGDRSLYCKAEYRCDLIFFAAWRGF
jgi:hypothetical protein